MRLLIDSLIAVMLVAILGGMALYYNQRHEHRAEVRFVHRALGDLRDQATYHKALRDAEGGAGGYPRKMAPAWFGRMLPLNVMVAKDQPWLDIAPEGDTAAHPPDPVIRSNQQAGFWYNPSNGIVRARVPERRTQAAMLELYNQLNSTNLTTLPGEGAPVKPTEREPTPVAWARPIEANGAPAGKASAAPAALTHPSPLKPDLDAANTPKADQPSSEGESPAKPPRLFN